MTDSNIIKVYVGVEFPDGTIRETSLKTADPDLDVTRVFRVLAEDWETWKK